MSNNKAADAALSVFVGEGSGQGIGPEAGADLRHQA